MIRPLLGVLSLSLLCGCHSARESVAPPRRLAVIHNAIDFGIGPSTFFVVSRVDGAVVHRKFNRDPVVEVEPGRRELGIRYYSEGFLEERSGADECRISLDARPGVAYYLEGAVEGQSWRARLVEADGSNEFPCSFGNGGTSGRVVGGSQRHAVSSRPVGAAERGEGESRSLPPAVVASGTAPEPQTADAAPAVREAAPPIERNDRAAKPTSELGVIAKTLRGRGHWGCPANLFRISAIDGEAIALGGTERIRLIGVMPEDTELYSAALRSRVGSCVSIEMEEALAGVSYRDRNGRLLVYLVDEEGALLNAEVIRAGAAKVDTRIRCRRLRELIEAQSAARAAGRGLWAR